MDLTPFKLDIDELVDDYTKVLFFLLVWFISHIKVAWFQFWKANVAYAWLQDELTTLADMKRVWATKKFSYIYEARPSSNSAFFMQSLFSQAIGMLSFVSFWFSDLIFSVTGNRCCYKWILLGWCIFPILVSFIDFNLWLQVIWLQKLLYHEDWAGSIAFTVFMKLSRTNLASRFICLLVCLLKYAVMFLKKLIISCL